MRLWVSAGGDAAPEQACRAGASLGQHGLQDAGASGGSSGEKRRLRDFFKEAAGEGGRSSSSHKRQREEDSGFLLGRLCSLGCGGGRGQAFRGEPAGQRPEATASAGQQGGCRRGAGGVSPPWGRRGLGLLSQVQGKDAGTRGCISESDPWLWGILFKPRDKKARVEGPLGVGVWVSGRDEQVQLLFRE